MSDTHAWLMSATTLLGGPVKTSKGTYMGHPKDVVLDVERGRIVCLVISFQEHTEVGEKLLAVPWTDLDLDPERNCAVLKEGKIARKAVPEFDPDEWPDSLYHGFLQEMAEYFGARPKFQSFRR